MISCINFHRVMGMGSGFTEPSPTGFTRNLPFESIAATDNSTVVMKLEEPSLDAAELYHHRFYRQHITPRGNRAIRRRQGLEEPGRHWTLYAD